MDNLLHSFLFTGNVNPLELGNTGKGGRRGTKKLFLQLHQSTCTNPYLNRTKGVYPLILNSIIFYQLTWAKSKSEHFRSKLVR